MPQGPASPINALISYLQHAVGGKYVRGATGQNGAWDCIAAGSLVATRRGEVPIQDVTDDDWVWTRDGWRRVLAAWKVRENAQVMAVHVAGRRLVGTPDHRVWTENRGWVKLSDLTSVDTLVSCRTERTSSSTASATTATPTRPGRRRAPTSSAAGRCSIEPSGNTLTAPSLPATRYTTSTTTPSTTTLPTLSALAVLNTDGSPRHIVASMTTSAPCAARRSGPTRRHSARSASAASSTSRSSTTTCVRGVSARHDVYDLMVEGTHEFFANGVLVHNCSGLVTAAYQQLGISLPPLTYSQVKYGQGVSTANLQPGDLVFFNGDGGRDFGHVGIYIGGGQYIQAASTAVGVVQSTLDPRRVQAVRRIMDGNGNLIQGDGLLPGHSSAVPVVPAAAASGPISQTIPPKTPTPTPPIPPTSSNQDIGSYLNHVATSATATGGAAPLQGSVDDIARQLYGYLASYLDDPEIGPILKQAASEQWDQARLAGAISKTQWWQHTGDSQRQWDAQEKTDPASTADKIKGQVANLSAEASGLGVNLTDESLQQIARDSLREGWNDAQVKAAIGSEALKNPALISQTTLTKYKQMASDYGVNWSNDGLSYWVKQGIQNGNDNGFLDQVRAYAKQLYPSIAADIDKGTTVAQYFDPYKQMAAQTLEMNPSAVDLSDPKWQRAIMSLDTKTNERRPMTLYEWQQTLKTDPTYGWDKTKGGHDAATQMATGLAQLFGKTAA